MAESHNYTEPEEHNLDIFQTHIETAIHSCFLKFPVDEIGDASLKRKSSDLWDTAHKSRHLSKVHTRQAWGRETANLQTNNITTCDQKENVNYELLFDETRRYTMFQYIWHGSSRFFILNKLPNQTL